MHPRLQNAIQMILAKYKEENKVDAILGLKEGDEISAVFPDGIITLLKTNNQIQAKANIGQFYIFREYLNISVPREDEM